MIKCNIVDETNHENFNFDVERLAKKILKTTTKILKIKTKHIISYIFVDLKKIQEINHEYRHLDQPTDVISFAYGDDYQDELPYELGDIFICVEKVISQAESYGHSILRECAFLMTHGILHLLGYDHIQKEDEEVMFKLQDDILTKLKIFK